MRACVRRSSRCYDYRSAILIRAVVCNATRHSPPRCIVLPDCVCARALVCVVCMCTLVTVLYRVYRSRIRVPVGLYRCCRLPPPPPPLTPEWLWRLCVECLSPPTTSVQTFDTDGVTTTTTTPLPRVTTCTKRPATGYADAADVLRLPWPLLLPSPPPLLLDTTRDDPDTRPRSPPVGRSRVSVWTHHSQSIPTIISRTYLALTQTIGRYLSDELVCPRLEERPVVCPCHVCCLWQPLDHVTTICTNVLS